MRYRGIRFANDRDIETVRSKVNGYIPKLRNDKNGIRIGSAEGRYIGIVELLERGELKKAAYAAKLARLDLKESIDILGQMIKRADEIVSMTEALLR